MIVVTPSDGCECKAFILSNDELRRYNLLTDQVKYSGGKVSSWWIRNTDLGEKSNYVEFVNVNGEIEMGKGSETNGIRPALWIIVSK